MSIKINNRYFTINYETQELAESFAYRMDCDVDDLAERLQEFVEKTEVVLEMSPDNLHVDIFLLEDSEAVAKIYNLTHRPKPQKAYYSRTDKAIYISVEDATERMMIHELVHPIVDASPKLSYKVHEYIAQLAEREVRT
jgi:dsDNA-binding SOS-regulon protein